MTQLKVEEVCSLSPVIPVVTIDDVAKAEPLARVLLASGIRSMEVTLRTPTALDCIRAIADSTPDMIVGAGTVLNADHLDAAIGAGARFALSPGATPKLLKAARKSSIPFLPGVATSSEAMRAMDLGYRILKFYPAEHLGGPSVLKVIGGPLYGAKFCPTGGITPESAPGYLALPNVVCIGGSWIAPPDKIKAGDWASIEKTAKHAAGLRG